MDWGQVNHVEAHFGGCLNPLVRGVEGARDPPGAFLLPAGALRAREELVPGGEERLLAVDVDRIVGSRRYQLTRPVPVHGSPNLVSEDDFEPVLHLLPGIQAGGRRSELSSHLGVAVLLGPLRGGHEQLLAIDTDQGDVYPGGDLDLSVVYPGFPGIAPA